MFCELFFYYNFTTLKLEEGNVHFATWLLNYFKYTFWMHSKQTPWQDVYIYFDVRGLCKFFSSPDPISSFFRRIFLDF